MRARAASHHSRAQATARALRRKLSLDDLVACRDELEALLDQARNLIDGPETEKMNTNDDRFERHHHNSNTNPIDLEPALKKGGAAAGAPDEDTEAPGAGVEEADTRTPS